MTILNSAAQVLNCYLEDCTELTVMDLVRRLGMPKSSASRLLRAMRDAGLLENVGDSKRYRPSLMLVNVGRSYRRSSTLVKRADAVVERVSQACGHTGYVSKRDGDRVIAVTDHPGTNSLRVVSTIGRWLPAFASATGRSLLARLDNEAVLALYPDGLPKAPSPTSPQDMAELFARLDDIRAGGVSTSHDEANRGVAAVAVAVGDGETGEEVSLCIVFPAAASDPEERLVIAGSLREGAEEIAALARDLKFVPVPSPGIPSSSRETSFSPREASSSSGGVAASSRGVAA